MELFPQEIMAWRASGFFPEVREVVTRSAKVRFRVDPVAHLRDQPGGSLSALICKIPLNPAREGL